MKILKIPGDYISSKSKLLAYIPATVTRNFKTICKIILIYSVLTKPIFYISNPFGTIR